MHLVQADHKDAIDHRAAVVHAHRRLNSTIVFTDLHKHIHPYEGNRYTQTCIIHIDSNASQFTLNPIVRLSLSPSPSPFPSRALSLWSTAMR